MPHPLPRDPDPPARADAAEIAADLERLRRIAPHRRRYRRGKRREVRQAEVAVLGCLVVAASFLALHLAQRGNEASLTLRTGASSPTTAPPQEHVAAGVVTSAPSEAATSNRVPVPPAQADTSPPAPRPPDRPSAVAPDTPTPTPTSPPTDVETPATTSTSTTSTSTTTTSTTPTTEPPPPPPPPPPP